MLSIFQRQFLMPWKKCSRRLKRRRQNTVPYMQYDLNCEIILILIHWKKKTKMHQTFNCIYLYIVGSQTECFTFWKSLNFPRN
jgi:hypothetical protein